MLRTMCSTKLYKSHLFIIVIIIIIIYSNHYFKYYQYQEIRSMTAAVA